MRHSSPDRVVDASHGFKAGVCIEEEVIYRLSSRIKNNLHFALGGGEMTKDHGFLVGLCGGLLGCGSCLLFIDESTHGLSLSIRTGGKILTFQDVVAGAESASFPSSTI